MLPLETRFCGLAGIHLALRSAPSPDYLAQLEAARGRAFGSGRLALIRMGDPPIRVWVHDRGRRGGYRFQCTARAGRETWLFKQPVSGTGWDSRFEFRCRSGKPLSAADVARRLQHISRALGVRSGVMSVSRLDFAVELLMPPDFEVNPTRFSTHSRARLRRDLSHRSSAISDDYRLHATWLARRISAVTIGRLPGREIELSRLPLPNQKTESTQSVTNSPPHDEWWRVDIRLGKKHLREVHKFNEFHDIGVRAIGLFRRAVTSVRYLADGNLALNISRHPTHPFWIGVQRAGIKSLEAERWP